MTDGTSLCFLADFVNYVALSIITLEPTQLNLVSGL